MGKAKVLGSAVIPISMGMERLDAQLAESKRKVDSGMDRLAAGAKKALAAAGVAAGAAFSYGLVRHMDIEKGTDKMAAQLGLTEEQSAAYGKAAGSLYADAYGESLEDVNTAVAAVGSTLADSMGNADDALETTSAKALNLASTFGVDVARAVSSAGVLFESGLAKDANHAFDLITAGMQQMPAHMRDELLEASDEYGKFFADLGYSGEEAFGMLVEASKEGMYGIDKTGDALKELTIRATDMSATSVAAYEAAGLNAEEMSAKFLAGGDVAKGALGEMVTGLQSIEDPVARANAAIGLFGTPLEDLAVTEIPAFLDSLVATTGGLENVEGAADRMGETLNDNAATNLEAFRREMDAKLVGFVGGKVIPALQSLPGPMGDVSMGLVAMSGGAAGVLAPLGQMTGGFRGWGKGLKVIPKGIEKVASGLGSMVGALGRGTKALVLNTASAVKSGAAMAATAAKQVAAWALMGAQSLAAAAKVALAWAISMGPILLVAAAVAGLVALIIVHWDTIKRVTGALWEGIKKGASAAWGAIKGAITTALNVIKSLFLNFTGAGLLIRHWDSIKAGFARAKDGVVSVANSMVSFFTGLPGRLRNAASGMWDGLKDAFRSAINWIIRAWNGMEFRIPGFDPPGPGPTFGGFTLGVPDIPYLAKGGSILDAGFAVVGEQGPELTWLPGGASVHSNADSGGLLAAAANAGSGMSPTPVNLYLDRTKVGSAIIDYVADHSKRNGYRNPFGR